MQRATHLLFLVFGAAMLFLGYLYQETYRGIPVAYAGFGELVVEDGSCPSIIRDAGVFPELKRIVTWPQGTSEANYKAECSSNWMRAKGDVVEIEYTARVTYPDAVLQIILEQKNSVQPQVFSVPRDTAAGQWRLLRFTLSENERDFRIRILDDAGSYSWLALRVRTNFYKRESRSTVTQYVVENKRMLQAPLLFFSALVLVASLIFFLRGGLAQRRFYVFVFFLVFSLSWQFSRDASFFSDDWHLLSIVSAEGLSSLWNSYSGHLMPVTYGLIYLQYICFQDYSGFLFVSLFLHALNALLVYALIHALITDPQGAAQRGVLPCICGFLYLSSALHGESTQWLSTQGSLLGFFCTLSAMTSALCYLRGEQRQYLGLSLLSAFLAPLCFASGILASPWVFLLLLYALISDTIPPNARSRAGRLFVAHGLILFSSLALYHFAAGGQKTASFTIEWLPTIAQYAFVGGYLATFLRASGFAGVYEAVGGEVNRHLLLGSCFGLLLSLGLLAVYYKVSGGRRSKGSSKQFRQDLCLWLLGQALMFLPYVLIAFGRIRLGNFFGVSQALVFRYHTFTLLGFCVCLVPLVRWICERPQYESQSSNYKRHALFILILVLQQMFQLQLAAEHSFIREDGYRTRIYLAQLLDWERELASSKASSIPLASAQHGVGELRGLYPLQYGRGWHLSTAKAIPSILPPERTLTVGDNR